MADKRRVKRSIKQLQRVKTWQLVILLILAGLVAATFLRLNNIGMVERRTAVFNADKQGNNSVTQNDLYSLQRYSAAHMNAGSGVMYLQDSYTRDVKKAISVASDQSKEAAQIDLNADKACKQQFSGYSQAYVQCFVAQQAKHPSTITDQTKANLPNPELYRHEFTSPLWSPDFAGWSLVVCAAITVVIFIRLLGLAILKILLKRHYDSI